MTSIQALFFSVTVIKVETLNYSVEFHKFLEFIFYRFLSSAYF